MSTVATVLSRAQLGIDAPLVRVEATLGSGLPTFSIVGLPEAVVKESKDRVRSALANNGYEWPSGRIIVNLAPADLPKEGGRFDLPIALGVLVATGQMKEGELAACEFYGELSLKGELRPVRSLLPAVYQATQCGHRVVLPYGNVAEAGLINHSRAAGATHLMEICAHLAGRSPLTFVSGKPCRPEQPTYPDVSDVRGQSHAIRALEIAAAGGHSLLLSGPPGSGKSMLAYRLCGLLPQMTEQESLETASVHSVSSRGFRAGEWACRPFRAPHHTASAVAMAGGGSPPRPGEISLAHNGVLFLDELPEFDRYVLEVLREPMERGAITISRAARQAEFPARFQLVAAMNPCPCGYLGDPQKSCSCAPQQIQRYRSRISGPLLDRIDLQIEVPRIAVQDLMGRQSGESSASIAARVRAARDRQLVRAGTSNSAMSAEETDKRASVAPGAQELLEDAFSRLGLSARGYHRVLRVALTIADLEGSPLVEFKHLAEAIQLRRGEPPR